MKTKTGLRVYVYKNASLGDCTAGGATSKHNVFTLIDPEVNGPFAPDAEAPEMNLVRRDICGQPYIHAVPASVEGKSSMFGGNYISTCDSRFSAVSKYPIPVHDRVEG